MDHWPQSLSPDPPWPPSCRSSFGNRGNRAARGSCSLAAEPCLGSRALNGPPLLLLHVLLTAFVTPFACTACVCVQSLWVTRSAWDACRFERERVRLGCPFPASNSVPRCLLPDLGEHVGNPTILVRAQHLPRLYSAFSLGLPLPAARSRSQQQQSSEGAGHLCLHQRGDPAGVLLLL